MKIPAYINSILERFDASGMEAFCVGGCVRDALMGLTPSDFDIATVASPDKIKEIFSDCRMIDTGIRHGTVTVLWEEIPVEITTYRVDGAYTDHRSPENVFFTDSLHEDCRRRDFTVNAMAYHPKHGICDFFGGREDLSLRTVRCVGDPGTRFSEDALRILRGLRFSATLDFDIEEQTARAMHEKAHLLSFISGERIVAELKKLLSGVRAASVLSGARDIIAVFLPWIKNLSLCERLQAVFCEQSDIAARMAGLLVLCGIKEQCDAKKALSHLPFDGAFIKKSVLLCELAAKAPPKTRYEVRCALGKLGEDTLPVALSLHRALFPLDAALCDEALDLLSESLSGGDCVTLSQLALSGDDLISLGFLGKEIGETLYLLLECVMRDTVQNEREALLALARAQLS